MDIPLSVASNRAVLSYDRLKRLTTESGATWPDLLIKDYQGILQDTITISNEVGEANEQVEINRKNIEELQAAVIELQERLTIVESDIEALQAKELKTYITNANYTAKPYQVILCTNTTLIDITLNDEPEVDELVHIKRTDAEVNILGTIDGVTDWTLNVKGYSMYLIFNGTDWSAI